MDLPGDQGSRHVRESGFWNLRNFCLWNPESGKFCESGILAFEIQSAAQRIRNATNDWNLQSIQVSMSKINLVSENLLANVFRNCRKRNN